MWTEEDRQREWDQHLRREREVARYAAAWGGHYGGIAQDDYNNRKWMRDVMTGRNDAQDKPNSWE
jgi:hypothetical protein